MGAVIQVQAEESEGDADGLHVGCWRAEPDDGDDNDEDAFQQRGDAVSDWRNHRQQDKGEDILPEVERAVEDELHRQAAVIERVGRLCEVHRAVPEEVAYDREAFGPEPDRARQDEGHSRRVAEQVEFVELLGPVAVAVAVLRLDARGFVEESLGKDVLRDEDDGGYQGVEDTHELALTPRVFAGTGEHDADCEGHQRVVGRARVADVEDQAVCEHCE